MSEATRSPWFATVSGISRKLLFFLGFGLVLTSQFACSTAPDTNVRTPARELYNQGLIAAEDQFFTEAEDLFTRLANEHSGTQLANLAHLQLGELHFKRSKWDEAEVSYRAFLLRNPNSHLTPYVISQIIRLNYERNQYGLFFRNRSFDRDMEPNRKIVQEYQRFYLLYRQSQYLEEVTELLHFARQDLAEYEFTVGNYYFAERAYDSAIARFLFLLKTYPEFPKKTAVANRLINAYELNQQPEQAQALRKTLQLQSSSSS